MTNVVYVKKVCCVAHEGILGGDDIDEGCGM